MSDAKYQLRNMMIDGLNMPDKNYNWNDMFYLTPVPPEHKKPNFGMAYVLLDKPMAIPEHEALMENYFQDMDEQNSIVLYYTTLFLACYHLTDPKIMPRIVWRTSGGVSIHDPIEDVKIHLRYGGVPEVLTQLPLRDPTEIQTSLDKTSPLFDKVLTISKNKGKKGKENPLIIALIVYQLTMEKVEILRNFLDFITILEALFSTNDGELSYKLALRVSFFIESDPTKRRDLFDMIRDAYDKRSELVHGSDTTLRHYSTYLEYRNKLEPCVRDSLLQYIDLMSKGKTKVDILKDIDHSILG